MKGGNQHQHEATESKKYNAGMEGPGSSNIEEEASDKYLQEQPHS
jgi:hypothetical protein